MDQVFGCAQLRCSAGCADFFLNCAEFMPNKAPPLSSMATTATGDVYLPDGTPSKFTKPQALDKAGINNVRNQDLLHCVVWSNLLAGHAEMSSSGCHARQQAEALPPSAQHFWGLHTNAQCLSTQHLLIGAAEGMFTILVLACQTG